MHRFHIEGFVTGFGNPDWAKTHEPATQTSTVVTALVEAGATCVAKTIVDDMAFGYVLNSVFPLIHECAIGYKNESPTFKVSIYIM